jgi:hypothetical protein
METYKMMDMERACYMRVDDLPCIIYQIICIYDEINSA